MKICRIFYSKDSSNRIISMNESNILLASNDFRQPITQTSKALHLFQYPT